MSWLTVVWSMEAGACLMLALIHGVIGFKQKKQPEHLLFALLAAAVAVFAGFEFALMNAQTPRQYGEIGRWAHPVVLVMAFALVAFVRLHFGTGRLGLAYAACGSRVLATLLNFQFEPNLNYREITALGQMTLPWGETVAVAEGVRNPWTAVDDVSLLLTLLFVLDASFALWRRGEPGDRRRSLLLGGSVTFFVLVAGGSAALIHAGVIHAPYLVSLAFLAVLLVMAYELSTDMLRAAQLGKRLEKSEARLRASQERMSLATAAAELGLWVWDTVRDEVWSTEQGRILHGIPPVARIDFARFLEALHEEDRDAVRVAVEKSLGGEGEYEGEYRVRQPDGPVRWLAARGRVEFDAQGRPVRMQGVSIDITRRKEAEQEVQTQRRELAHLSRVALLGELSGSLAHELNQPLTAILSNAQAARRFLERDDAELGEVKEILKDIEEEDKRAGEVIHRLRLLLKKGEVQPFPADLNALVREVLKLMRSDLENHGVTVAAELAPALPPVLADKIEIQQVVLNLLVNGCDAMVHLPPPERRLVVRTGVQESAWVSVQDRGHGIAPENLQRMFDPFVTTKTHGMGLGLSVCRAIVSAHGGKIWATNNPDGGATVHFSLPIHTAEDA